MLELSELENAFLKTKADLIKLIDDLDKNGDSIDSEIFQTHLLMLEDSMFREDIKRHVSEHRKERRIQCAPRCR
ncbi:MAG: hypothetical protein LRY51_04250 [Geovibrio sp.]|nr:hypothetical protein [Geovibrio sp.]